MAKAPATPSAETEQAPKKKGKKLLLILLIVIAAVVIAAAGLVGFLLLKKAGSAEDVEAAGSGAPTVDLSRPPVFVSLDAFVVNLLPGEGDRYLQVVMALRVRDARTGDSLKGFMPEIRHRINMLLANRLPSELATLEGREELAKAIVDEVNTVLGFGPAHPAEPAERPIQAVLFNSFIIQ